MQEFNVRGKGEAILGPGPFRAEPRARAKGPLGRAESGVLGSHPLFSDLGLRGVVREFRGLPGGSQTARRRLPGVLRASLGAFQMPLKIFERHFRCLQKSPLKAPLRSL